MSYKNYKKIIYIAIFLIFSIAVVALLGRLFMPKYVSSVKEGDLTGDYYLEKVPHDVIFLGDCEVFENFSPVTIWENYGISSYIRGSAQQLVWHSYRLLEEVFTREKPKAVVYNVQAMKYPKPQKEAYNRMTLDGMPLSIIKLKAVIDSMTENESLASYVFPLLRYHERWKELGPEDFKHLFKNKPVSDSGYLMRCDIKPLERLPEPGVITEPISEKCFSYLRKMKELCDINGAELILIKSPSLYPHWHDEWDKQVEEFAKTENLRYINLLNSFDEIGLDMSHDSYDAGLHLNVYGAEKLSLYFGKYLMNEFDFKKPEDERILRLWEEKCSVYHGRKELQEKEFRELGYIRGIK